MSEKAPLAGGPGGLWAASWVFFVHLKGGVENEVFPPQGRCQCGGSTGAPKVTRPVARS